MVIVPIKTTTKTKTSTEIWLSSDNFSFILTLYYNKWRFIVSLFTWNFPWKLFWCCSYIDFKLSVNNKSLNTITVKIICFLWQFFVELIIRTKKFIPLSISPNYFTFPHHFNLTRLLFSIGCHLRHLDQHTKPPVRSLLLNPMVL